MTIVARTKEQKKKEHLQIEVGSYDLYVIVREKEKEKVRGALVCV